MVETRIQQFLSKCSSYCTESYLSLSWVTLSLYCLCPASDAQSTQGTAHKGVVGHSTQTLEGTPGAKCQLGLWSTGRDDPSTIYADKTRSNESLTHKQARGQRPGSDSDHLGFTSF